MAGISKSEDPCPTVGTAATNAGRQLKLGSLELVPSADMVARRHGSVQEPGRPAQALVDDIAGGGLNLIGNTHDTS